MSVVMMQATFSFGKKHLIVNYGRKPLHLYRIVADCMPMAHPVSSLKCTPTEIV